MSHINFNQISNNLLSNNDIEMKEPSANRQAPNCVFNIERKQFKCNIDPNILTTNLLNYMKDNMNLKFSKNRESDVIQEIVGKVDNLSANLVNIFSEFQQKFDSLADKIFDYTKINDAKVEENANKIQYQNDIIIKIHNLISNLEKRTKELEKFNRDTSDNLGNILNVYKEQKSSSDVTNKKVEQIETILKNNNIKIEEIKVENKNEIKDIEIKEFEKNSNEKTMKYKIFIKNNALFFDEITKDCGEEGEKEKELVDKFKIIFKKDKNIENNIIYEISTLCKDWDFSRHMKNVMKRLYRSRYYRRINLRNLDHVYRLKWSKKQIQFEKIQATQKYINNNNFFVKFKNSMILVKNKKRYSNNFKFNRFNRVNYYNNKNISQNLLGKFNKDFNTKLNVNTNINNKNNSRNNNKNNNKNNNRMNKKSFNNRRRFNNNNKRYNNRFNNNRNRYYNNNKRNGAIIKVLRFLPKMLGSNPRGQNFRI